MAYWELYTFWGMVSVDILLSIVLIGLGISSFDLLSKAGNSTNQLQKDDASIAHRYIMVIVGFIIFNLLVISFSLYYWYILYNKIAAIQGWIQKVRQSYWLHFLSIIVIAVAYLLQFICIGLSYVPYELVRNLVVVTTPTDAFTQNNLDMLKSNINAIIAIIMISTVLKVVKIVWAHGWALSTSNAAINSEVMDYPSYHQASSSCPHFMKTLPGQSSMLQSSSSYHPAPTTIPGARPYTSSPSYY